MENENEAELFLGYPAEEQGDNLDTLRNRIGEDLKTWHDEATESGYRASRLGASIVAAATQLADRSRLLAIALPSGFDHALKYGAEHGFNGYENASVSAVAVGGIFAVWSWIVGRSLQSSINHLPRTTETVAENHPAMVAAVTKAVGGFENPNASDRTAKNDKVEYYPYQTRKSWLGRAALALTRGGKTAVLYGSTAYVGVSKVQNMSDESTSRIRRTVTAEGAAVWGGVAASVSALVTNANYEVAQNVKDALEYKPLWLGISAALIAISAIGNKIARKSAEAEMEQDR